MQKEELEHISEPMNRIFEGAKKAARMNSRHNGPGHYEYNPDTDEVEFNEKSFTEFLDSVPF